MSMSKTVTQVDISPLALSGSFGHFMLNLSCRRKVLFDCHYCKRERVSSKPPSMSKLTIERLSAADEPFAHTGINYFGPLLVKLNKKTRANQAVAKRYGAIVTCLSSRPSHIELTEDLSTDSLILVFRRFISRRGYPKSNTSDNGTDVVGNQGKLSEAFPKLDNSRIKDDFNRNLIHLLLNEWVALWSPK